jgi:hypothetical protein
MFLFDYDDSSNAPLYGHQVALLWKYLLDPLSSVNVSHGLSTAESRSLQDWAILALREEPCVLINKRT